MSMDTLRAAFFAGLASGILIGLVTMAMIYA